MSRKSAHRTKVQMQKLEAEIGLERRRLNLLVNMLGGQILKIDEQIKFLRESVSKLRFDLLEMHSDFYHPQREQDGLADGMAAHEALHRVRHMECKMERLEHKVNKICWMMLLAHLTISLQAISVIVRW